MEHGSLEGVQAIKVCLARLRESADCGHEHERPMNMLHTVPQVTEAGDPSIFGGVPESTKAFCVEPNMLSKIELIDSLLDVYREWCVIRRCTCSTYLPRLHSQANISDPSHSSFDQSVSGRKWKEYKTLGTSHPLVLESVG